MTFVHWDDVEGFAIPDNAKPLGGRWQRLGDAAGSVRVGMQRVSLTSGQLATPPHLHTAEEEIYFVLSGSATLWQDGKTCTVHTGDTIVFVPGGPTHTLIGDDGFEALIFGTRLTPESGVLPRTKTAWLARSPVHFSETHPWEQEAKLGLPEGEPGDRPPNVAALDEVEGDYGGLWKRVGAAGGAKRTGLNWPSCRRTRKVPHRTAIPQTRSSSSSSTARESSSSGARPRPARHPRPSRSSRTPSAPAM